MANSVTPTPSPTPSQGNTLSQGSGGTNTLAVQTSSASQTPPQGDDNTYRERYRRYFANFTVRLGILRTAAVALSILSFLTTFEGFKNTIFAGNGLYAGIASAAVQSILLAGVFFYMPICNMLLNVMPAKKNVGIYSKTKTGKINSKRRLWRIGWVTVISLILICAMVMSSTFSSISITNSLYETDYARDSDALIEETIRQETLILDGEIKELLSEKAYNNKQNKMRFYLIDKLQKVEKSIESAAQKNAKEYFTAAPTVKVIEKASALYDDLGGLSVDEYVHKRAAELNEEAKKDKPFGESWCLDAKKAIEKGNGEIHKIYEGYYDAYSDLVDQYNNMRKYATGKVNDDTKKLTLTKAKAIRSSLVTLRDAIAYEGQIDRWHKEQNHEGKKAEGVPSNVNVRNKVNVDKGESESLLIQLENLHQLKWVDKEDPSKGKTVQDNIGKMVDRQIETCLNLRSAIVTFISTIDDMVETVYGTANVLTVDEIIEIIGQSDPTDEPKHYNNMSGKVLSDMDILEQADKQLRNAQGTIIKQNTTDGTDTTGSTDTPNAEIDVEELFNTFGSYIQLMKTRLEVQKLSDELNASYIITSNPKEEKTDDKKKDNSSGFFITILHKILEPAKSTSSVNTSDSSSADESGDISGSSSANESGDTSGSTSGDESGDTSGSTPADESGDTSGITSGDESGDGSGSTSADKSKKDSGSTPANGSRDTSTSSSTDGSGDGFPVEQVSVDNWLKIRNSQLSKLKELITNFQFVNNSIEKNIAQTHADFQNKEKAVAEVDYLIHIYINATPIEKTWNLLFNHEINDILSESGKESSAIDPSDLSAETVGIVGQTETQIQHFTYRGKAKLAVGIAIFMDFGSACIGVLMYLLDPKEMEHKLYSYYMWITKGKAHQKQQNP